MDCSCGAALLRGADLYVAGIIGMEEYSKKEIKLYMHKLFINFKNILSNIGQ